MRYLLKIICTLTVVLLFATPTFAADKEQSLQELLPLREVQLLINTPTKLDSATEQAIYQQVRRSFRFPEYALHLLPNTRNVYVNPKAVDWGKLAQTHQAQYLVLLDIQVMEEYTTTRFWDSETLLVVNLRMQTYIYDTKHNKLNLTKFNYHDVSEQGSATGVIEVLGSAVGQASDKIPHN